MIYRTIQAHQSAMMHYFASLPIEGHDEETGMREIDEGSREVFEKQCAEFQKRHRKLIEAATFASETFGEMMEIFVPKKGG